MKISIVSYLNSKPFIFGLEQHAPGTFELSLDIPSECARKLMSGEVEIGLVPVAVLKQMPHYYIISDYCIGAIGKVDSVKLYSAVPLSEISHVQLDYQSRTSVALVKILAKELWKIDPIWESSSPGYENQINGNRAAVIIGDRTFGLNGKYAYEYDLSEAWFELTGLPFVFAAWVSKEQLNLELVSLFSESLRMGLAEIPKVVSINQGNYPGIDINQYLTQSISYRLDEAKREALSLFLSKLE